MLCLFKKGDQQVGQVVQDIDSLNYCILRVIRDAAMKFDSMRIVKSEERVMEFCTNLATQVKKHSSNASFDFDLVSGNDNEVEFIFHIFAPNNKATAKIRDLVNDSKNLRHEAFVWDSVVKVTVAVNSTP